MADKKNTTAKKETAVKTNAAVTAAAATVAAAKKTEAAAPAAKTADTVKKTEAPKKTETKKAEPRVQEVYFEFDGKQVEAGQVVSLIEQAYKNEGHQVGRIKDLKVYINSEEGKAYYVINGDNGEGKYIEL